MELNLKFVDNIQQNDKEVDSIEYINKTVWNETIDLNVHHFSTRDWFLSYLLFFSLIARREKNNGEKPRHQQERKNKEVHTERAQIKEEQKTLNKMNRSESSESLLPSTSREPRRQDYQSIGETTVVAQCLCLISDIIYAKMHAINSPPAARYQFE